MRIFIIILTFFVILSACTGPEGAEIPGGILSICITNHSAAADLAAVIAFDDDYTFSNGNEINVTVPLADYVSAGNNIIRTITWRAENIPVGEYYVYAWLDNNSNREFDNAIVFENSSLTIYDESGAYVPSPVGAPHIEISSTYVLVPNYIITNDYAADLDFDWTNP